MTPNSHIEEYLDYYLSLTEPGFAVLLDGSWGCGKTHFIDKYIKDKSKIYAKDHDLKKKRKPFLYISLNGLNATTSIDDKIFCELHPILSHKSVAFFSGIVNSALKFGAKLDLGNGDKADIQTGGFSLSLKDLFGKIKVQVLVFDDLERCNIPPAELLGYINQYVEHEKLKVICIAYEKEMDRSVKAEILEDESKSSDKPAKQESSVKQKSKYSMIKEKVIGKTFLIEDEFETAFPAILSSIEENKGNFPRSTIEGYKPLIMEIYKESEKNNLRLLKHTLLDWLLFWDALSDKIKERPELLRDLLRNFLILSLELKSGSISNKELQEISKSTYIGSFSETIFDKTFNKYPVFSLYNLILPVSEWEEIFSRGIPDKIKLNESLLKTQYFYDENTPTWKKFWNYRNLSDEKFNNYFNEVKLDFEQKKINDPGVILVIATTFLHLCEYGLTEKNKGKIKEEFFQYIDHLHGTGSLTEDIRKRISRGSYDGIEFPDRSQKEFHEVFQYLKSKTEDSIKESYFNVANKLLDTLSNKAGEFRSIIREKYATIPIFSYMDLKEIFNALLSLENQQLPEFGYLLDERYDVLYIEYLKADLEFLKQLESLILEKLKTHSGSVSKILLSQIQSRHLKSAIGRLENVVQKAGS